MKPLHSPLHYLILPLLLLCMTSTQAVEPQISAGKYQNMAIDSDGAAYLWRASEIPHHMNNKSLWHPEDSPTRIEGLPPAIAVAAGASEFAEALTADGAIYEWGYGPIQNQRAKANHPFWGVCELLNIGYHPGSGPCGMDAKDFDAAFFVAKPTHVKDIPPATALAASDIDVLALTRSGEVYCWGVDAPPQRVPGLSDIVAIGLGQDHGIALRKDGAVITWGKRALGLPPAPPQIDDHSVCDEPTSQVVMNDAIGVYATDQASYAWRKDGTVWAWGNIAGQSNGKRHKQVWQPEQIAAMPEISTVTATSGYWVARTADSRVYAQQTPKRSRIAQDVAIPDSPALIDLKLPGTIAISTSSQTLALTKDGFVCAWDGDINKHPHAVMLANGNTPLMLYPNRKGLPDAPADLCAVDK